MLASSSSSNTLLIFHSSKHLANISPFNPNIYPGLHKSRVGVISCTPHTPSCSLCHTSICSPPRFLNKRPSNMFKHQHSPFFFSFYLVFNRNGWLWSLIPHSSICSPQQNNGNLRHFHMSERGFVFVTRRRGIEMCVSKTNKSHFGLHYSKEWAKVSVCLKFSEKHGVSYITQDSQDLSRVCGKGTTNILSPPYITTLCFPFTPSPFQPLP